MSDLSASPTGNPTGNPTEHPDPVETARALLDAGSPGPWHCEDDGAPEFGEAVVSAEGHRIGCEFDAHNAEFIAAAPTLIADLLARVESQAAEITRLRDDYEALVTRHHELLAHDLRLVAELAYPDDISGDDAEALP